MIFSPHIIAGGNQSYKDTMLFWNIISKSDFQYLQNDEVIIETQK